MMRKKLMSFVMAAGTLFMASCSSDETNGEIDGGSGTVTHSVRVVASGFNESIGPMITSRTSSIGEHISQLRYIVYTEWGTIVGMPAIQNKRMSESPLLPPDPFGTMDLKLPEGRYTLVVLGEAKNDDGTYATFDSGPTHVQRDTRLINFNKPRNVGDLFVKVQSLVVGDDDIELPVRLERSVGQLAVNINENIPVGTSKVDILLNQDVFLYYFGEDRVEFNTSGGSVYSFTIKPDQVGTFFSEKIHILNTYNPFSVTIASKDIDGNVIATRTVHNVSVPKNKRVTLSTDNFFGGTTPVDPIAGEVVVAIDPSWGTAPIAGEL